MFYIFKECIENVNGIKYYLLKLAKLHFCNITTNSTCVRDQHGVNSIFFSVDKWIDFLRV